MILKKLRQDYKWVVLAVCFLMEFLCLGFCSSNMGLNHFVDWLFFGV